MTNPLTPHDCDLQDFAFMPLDVARLRDSDLASDESPEACWAAVLLWAASWHQVPAASIPNNETWIAKQAGYMARGKIAREWAEVKQGAMRGWILCSDDRWYHPVVAEKAMDAWKSKIEQRYKTEVARVKKHNQRHGTKHSVPAFEVWLSLGRPAGHHLSVPEDSPSNNRDNHGDKASKGQGEGQGQGQGDFITGTNVPDGDAVEAMTKDELWSTGKSLLEQAGMPSKQCGSFVGKLCKDYGNDVVIEAVRQTCIERPADPATYLKALCQHAVGQRKQPKSFAQIEREKGWDRWEEMTGQIHPERNQQQSLQPVIDVSTALRVAA